MLGFEPTRWQDESHSRMTDFWLAEECDEPMLVDFVAVAIDLLCNDPKLLATRLANATKTL